MKVIEDKSRVSDAFPLEVDCSKCGSKLRVDLGDLQYGKWKVGGYWFAGTEVIEAHFTFDCAACGHGFNPVDGGLIPIGIRDDLVAAYRERKASGAPII